MITAREILNWGQDELKEFIDNPAAIENDRYEFKRIYKSKAKEIRKDFSSFANFKGGFIFYGVDNNKNICGVDKDDEITTFLNRSLNNVCLQPPIEKWELIKAIRVTKRKPEKYVYIYYVHPTLFINRPHVSDGVIYIRQNGESKQISSGIEIRRQFFTAKFYPEHIDQLELELENIRDYEYKGSELDIIYIRYLGAYLNELKKNSKEETKAVIDTLILQFHAMADIIAEVNRSRAVIHSATGIPPLSNSSDLKSKYEKLKEIVGDFITKFKGFHNI